MGSINTLKLSTLQAPPINLSNIKNRIKIIGNAQKQTWGYRVRSTDVTLCYATLTSLLYLTTGYLFPYIGKEAQVLPLCYAAPTSLLYLTTGYLFPFGIKSYKPLGNVVVQVDPLAPDPGLSTVAGILDGPRGDGL